MVAWDNDDVRDEFGHFTDMVRAAKPGDYRSVHIERRPDRPSVVRRITTYMGSFYDVYDHEEESFNQILFEKLKEEFARNSD